MRELAADGAADGVSPPSPAVPPGPAESHHIERLVDFETADV